MVLLPFVPTNVAMSVSSVSRARTAQHGSLAAGKRQSAMRVRRRIAFDTASRFAEGLRAADVTGEPVRGELTYGLRLTQRNSMHGIRR